MMIQALRRVITRMHCPPDVMLTCVRWYTAWPLSLRHIKEMMDERGMVVDHATVHRRAIKALPVLAAVFGRRKLPSGISWRRDETCILVSDQWKYLYLGVDHDGDKIDFLLRAKTDCAAARRFLEHAIDLHGVPVKITIEKRGANTAAIKSMAVSSPNRFRRQHRDAPDQVPQQQRRAGPPGCQTRRATHAGFKTYRCARALIAGIETMHMIRQGQLDILEDQAASALNACGINELSGVLYFSL